MTPETGPAISYTYDRTGRRTSMTDGAGETSYAYDPLGRLTSATRGGRTVGYSYDPAGRPLSVAYPGSIGTVEYGYDASGRLASITDWADRDTTFAYDDASRLITLTQPGDVVTSYTYDELDRPTSVLTERGSTEILELGYAYDAAGNLTGYTDDTGTAAFTYDDLDRLVAADYPGTGDYAYAYDAAGNATSITSPAGTQTLTYDAADRISSTGYTYDANGSLTADPTRAYSYDALDRLVGVTGTGLDLAYTLDGDGNRTAETLGSTTTSFDLDLRGYPTVLFDGTRTYLPGAPNLGFEQSGVWRSGLVDLHGSLLGSVASGGAVSAFVRYDPYGGARPGSTINLGIGWTGEWTDAAGLVNLRARAYDPGSARFVSRDSFGGFLAQPLTGNRYLFGSGSPLAKTDPSGHLENNVLVPYGDAISAAVQFTPLAGDIVSFCSAVLGADCISGTVLSELERGAAMAAILPWVPNVAPIGRIAPRLVDPLATAARGPADELAETFGQTRYLDETGQVAGGAPGPRRAPDTGVPVLGRGSTGRTTPNDLGEDLAMREVRSNPAGQPLPLDLGDSRWPATEGWVKYGQRVNGVTIHYNFNPRTGQYDDFKFKDD